MRNLLVAVLTVIALLAGAAHAESRASRLARAHEKLRESDPAAALEILRELQVEEPGDERVLYALACAQYRIAEAKQAVQRPGEDPAAAYREAQAGFEALTGAKDPAIARQASFDRANCLAQTAKLGAGDPERAKEAIAGLRNAAAAYEAHLLRFPDDKGARQNLDHVRFLLKTLQQKEEEQPKEDQQGGPPPEQPPAAMLSVRNPATEIPGAKAVVSEDAIVQLVTPSAPGATP